MYNSGFPLHMIMIGTLPVRALLMKDQTSKVNVGLFGLTPDRNYSSGDVIQVSAAYAKTYKNNVQLTTSPSCKCEVNNFIF